VHPEAPRDVLGEDKESEINFEFDLQNNIAVCDDKDNTKPLHYTCKSREESSNKKAKLDDEGTKSVTVNAKKLCEDTCETAMGQRDMVIGDDGVM
jgi:hypothetical protein